MSDLVKEFKNEKEKRENENIEPSTRPIEENLKPQSIEDALPVQQNEIDAKADEQIGDAAVQEETKSQVNVTEKSSETERKRDGETLADELKPYTEAYKMPESNNDVV